MELQRPRVLNLRNPLRNLIDFAKRADAPKQNYLGGRRGCKVVPGLMECSSKEPDEVGIGRKASL